MRYLYLNTRLPFHEIARVVDLHAATVTHLIKDDVYFQYKVYDRLVVELENAREIEQEINTKTEHAFKWLLELVKCKREA